MIDSIEKCHGTGEIYLMLRIDSALIKAVRTLTPPDKDPDEFLAEQLPLLQNIDKNIQETVKRKCEEEKHHKEEMLHLEGEINKFRVQCIHPLTHYIDDPEGGSDSTETCFICGKQARKL